MLANDHVSGGAVHSATPRVRQQAGSYRAPQSASELFQAASARPMIAQDYNKPRTARLRINAPTPNLHGAASLLWVTSLCRLPNRLLLILT